MTIMEENLYHPKYAVKVRVQGNLLVADEEKPQETLFETISKKKITEPSKTKDLDKKNQNVIVEILKFLSTTKTMKKFKSAARQFLFAICSLGRFKNIEGRKKRIVKLEKYNGVEDTIFSE